MEEPHMNFASLTARTFLAFALLAPATLAGCAVESTDDVVAQSEEQDIKQKSGKFELFQGADGQVYFHLLAANGENVLRSEGYSSWSAAAAGIKSVQSHGTSDERYELNAAADGRWYFNLRAVNGQVIATSQLYTTKQHAETAIFAIEQIVAKTIELGNAPTGAPRVVVFKGLDSRYYFHVRAKNGEIVLQSQSYSSKSAAEKGVSSVLTNGQKATNYMVQAAANGQYYFTLRAANHATIGVSEMYSSKWNAQKGAEGVQALLVSDAEALPQ
jgi:uncharacterized protein